VDSTGMDGLNEEECDSGREHEERMDGGEGELI